MVAYPQDQIPEMAIEWLEEGRLVALATVIDTWGSAPRPVGSQLVISSESAMAGSVSGGCVEGAVVLEALEALDDGKCRVLEYGVADEEAFAVGLACGGTIRILVEPVGRGEGPSRELIEEIVRRRQKREAFALVTDLTSWERRLVAGGDDPLHAEISEGHRIDRSLLVGGQFIRIFNPPLKLAIIGAVHIAQHLSKLASQMGFDVAVIDPREAFLTEERFTSEFLMGEWPDEALKRFGLDQRTAVVTLAHDPKIDLPAIETALDSPVFYIGSLGSKKTHAKRVDALLESGVDREAIARIHGPVGLNIGGRSPAEIALSIMAEVIERLRRPETRPEIKPE